MDGQPDKLQQVYGYIQQQNSDFKVDYNTFKSDMQNPDKLQQVHSYLGKINPDFKVDFSTFKNDMGVAQPLLPQQPQAQPPTIPTGEQLTGLSPQAVNNNTVQQTAPTQVQEQPTTPTPQDNIIPTNIPNGSELTGLPDIEKENLAKQFTSSEAQKIDKDFSKTLYDINFKDNPDLATKPIHDNNNIDLSTATPQYLERQKQLQVKMLDVKHDDLQKQSDVLQKNIETNGQIMPVTDYYALQQQKNKLDQNIADIVIQKKQIGEQGKTDFDRLSRNNVLTPIKPQIDDYLDFVKRNAPDQYNLISKKLDSGDMSEMEQVNTIINPALIQQQNKLVNDYNILTARGQSLNKINELSLKISDYQKEFALMKEDKTNQLTQQGINDHNNTIAEYQNEYAKNKDILNTVSKINDLNTQQQQLLVKYAKPIDYSSGEQWGQGTVKELNNIIPSIFDDFDKLTKGVSWLVTGNKNILTNKITGSGKTIWGEQADKWRSLTDTNPDMPQTIPAEVLKQGIQLAPFFAELALTPEIGLTKGALPMLTNGQATKMVLPKIVTLLAGKNMVEEFDRKDSNNLTWSDVGDIVKAGEQGALDGMILHGIGYISKDVSKFAEDLVKLQSDFMPTAGQQAGKRALASLGSFTTQAGGFTLFDLAQQYTLTGKINTDQAISSGLMGAVFSIPEIYSHITADKVANGRANYYMSSNDMIKFASEIDATPQQIKDKLQEITEQYQKETNPKNQQILEKQFNALGKLLDLKVNDVIAKNNPDVLRKDLQEALDEGLIDKKTYSYLQNKINGIIEGLQSQTPKPEPKPKQKLPKVEIVDKVPTDNNSIEIPIPEHLQNTNQTQTEINPDDKQQAFSLWKNENYRISNSKDENGKKQVTVFDKDNKPVSSFDNFKGANDFLMGEYDKSQKPKILEQHTAEVGKPTVENTSTGINPTAPPETVPEKVQNEVQAGEEKNNTEHRTNIETKFRDTFKKKGVSDEHIDGALALMNARAKSWASEEAGRNPDDWYKQIADVKEGEFQSTVDKNVQYQIKDSQGKDITVQPLSEGTQVVNGFYSPIEEKINSTKKDSQTAEQWLNDFGKTKDETVYTGLAEFLGSKKPKEMVSKQEVLDYLKNNRVQIVEKVLGEPTESEIDTFLDDEVGQGYTREEARDFLENDEDRTKFSQYQTEGEKSGYKEVLIMLPQKDTFATLPSEWKQNSKGLWAFFKGDKQVSGAFPKESDIENARGTIVGEKTLDKTNFRSSHFEEPNIVAHLRMNIRTDAEGKKTLFLEEIQSDWGQKGKKEGFIKESIKPDLEKTRLELEKVQNEMKKILNNDKKLQKLNIENTNDKFLELIKNTHPRLYELNTDESILLKKESELQRRLWGEVPQAPYVTNTTAWVKLGLKTALQHAVNEGADRISWTTGEQQNERYDLSKQVDYIKKSPNTLEPGKSYVDISTKNGIYNLTIDNKTGEITNQSGNTDLGQIIGKNLEDVVGKEVAQRVLESKQNTRLEGEGLKVGGKGMIGFYGSPKEGKLGIVGEVAESIFGKGSVKTNDINGDILNEGTPPETEIFKDEQTGKYKVRELGSWDNGVYNDPSEFGNEFKTKEEAEEWIKQIYKTEQLTSQQHSIDITPKLKAEAERGLPQFQEKQGRKAGALETLKDGRVIIHALDSPDVSTLVHEIGHIFEKDLTPQESKLFKGEQFARGFERYLRDGKAPTEELKSLFTKFKQWLTDIYSRLKGTPIEKKLSPEMKQVFDRLLTEPKSKPESEPIKPSEPNVPKEEKSVLNQEKTGSDTNVPTKTETTDNKEKTATEKTLKDIPIEDIHESEYPRWVAENSNDPQEIKQAYDQESLNTPDAKLKDWQRDLLEETIGRKGFIQEFDKNKMTAGLAKSWIRNDGTLIDEIHRVLNEKYYGNETDGVTPDVITMKDIVDFIEQNPDKKAIRKTTDLQNELRTKYKQLTGRSINNHKKWQEEINNEKLTPEHEEFIRTFDPNNIPDKLLQEINDYGITLDNFDKWKGTEFPPLENNEYLQIKKYLENEANNQRKENKKGVDGERTQTTSNTEKKSKTATKEPEKVESEPQEPKANTTEKNKADKELTPLQQSLETLKQAKEKLKARRQNLGIVPDNKGEADDLFELHKAYVNVAKEYIKQGAKDIKDWAKEIGEDISDELKKAWDEAKGIIKPLTIDDFKKEFKNKEENSTESDMTKMANHINDEFAKEKLGKDIFDNLMNKLPDTDIRKKYDEVKVKIEKGNSDFIEKEKQKIIDTGKFSDESQIILAYDLATLKGEEANIIREINKTTDPDKKVELQNDLLGVLNKMQTNFLANRLIGRGWQAVGRIRQAFVDKDINLQVMMEQFKASKGVKSLTVEQQKTITEQYNKIKDLETKLKDQIELEKQNKQTNDKLTKENETLKKLNESLKQQKKNDIKLSAKEKINSSNNREVRIKQNIKNIIHQSMGQASVNPVVESAKLAVEIGKLAAEKVYKGAVKLDEITRLVLEDLKNIDPYFKDWDEKKVREHIEYVNKRNPVSEKSKQFQILKKTAQTQGRTERGDFETSKNKPPEDSAEIKALKKQYQLARFEWDKARRQDILENRPIGEKIKDYFFNWQRFAVLSYPSTMVKLAAVVGYGVMLKPVKFLAQGVGYGTMKGLGKITGQDLVSHGVWGKPQVKALGKFYSEFVRNFSLENLKEHFKGIDYLEAQYGNSHIYDEWSLAKGILQMPGRSHGYIKSFIKNPEFAYAHETAIQNYLDKYNDINKKLSDNSLTVDQREKLTNEQKDFDVTKDEVIERINHIALQHGKWSILMNDNKKVDNFRFWLNSKGLFPSFVKSEIPVLKIPVNFVSRAFFTKYGLVRAVMGKRTIQSIGKDGVKFVDGKDEDFRGIAEILIKGSDGMKESEKELLSKSIAMGSLGVGLLAFGYLDRHNFKKNDDGSYIVHGINIGKNFIHIPEFESIFSGVEIGNRHDEDNKPTSFTNNFVTKLIESDIDLLKKMPFMNMLTYGAIPKIVSAMYNKNPDKLQIKLADALGAKVSNFFTPGFVKQGSEALDTGQKGFHPLTEPIKRKASGDAVQQFFDELKMGTPWRTDLQAKPQKVTTTDFSNIVPENNNNNNVVEDKNIINQ